MEEKIEFTDIYIFFSHDKSVLFAHFLLNFFHLITYVVVFSAQLFFQPNFKYYNHILSYWISIPQEMLNSF